MIQCWESKSKKRPSFSDLVHSLSVSMESMAGYIDISESVLKSEESEDDTAQSMHSEEKEDGNKIFESEQTREHLEEEKIEIQVIGHHEELNVDNNVVRDETKV